MGVFFQRRYSFFADTASNGNKYYKKNRAACRINSQSPLEAQTIKRKRLNRSPDTLTNASHFQIILPSPDQGFAVKCCEKKIIFNAYFLRLFAMNAVSRGELFIFTPFSVFLKKETPLRGFGALNSSISSTAPTLIQFNACELKSDSVNNSCELKSDSVNVGKQMQCIFCKK